MQGRPVAAKSVTVAAPPRMVQAGRGPFSLRASGCENATQVARRLPRIWAIHLWPRQSVPAAITLSLRRLWTIYKGTSIGLLMVLARLIERGEYPELHEIIKRQGPEDSRHGGIERRRWRCCLAAIARNCHSGALRAPIHAP
jgi:hypothetical protein